MDIPREAIELSYEREGYETVQAKRELGNGRWDRALKKNLVLFSEADNYDDAKLEWLATGNVWWKPFYEESSDAPDWVLNSHQGYGKCLCGHPVKYHFEIQNTVNGNIECVGSDHINTYLIIRAIRESTGLADEFITDEMIAEWIDVRVEGMKKESWWEQHGSMFEFKFNRIKDLDLRINVRTKGQYYDGNLGMMRDKTFIRKRAMDGEMASIVWRWNHPNNPKAQINTRGYPNRKLLQDLDDFYYESKKYQAIADAEDAMIEDRINQSREMRKEKEMGMVVARMQFYGITHYALKRQNTNLNNWESTFLEDIERRIVRHPNKPLSKHQIDKLWEIFSPATDKQKAFMAKLGFTEEEMRVTKRQASSLISEAVEKQDGLNSEDEVDETRE